jgi:hypothetical protein
MMIEHKKTLVPEPVLHAASFASNTAQENAGAVVSLTTPSVVTPVLAATAVAVRPVRLAAAIRSRVAFMGRRMAEEWKRLCRSGTLFAAFVIATFFAEPTLLHESHGVSLFAWRIWADAVRDFALSLVPLCIYLSNAKRIAAFF